MGRPHQSHLSFLSRISRSCCSRFGGHHSRDQQVRGQRFSGQRFSGQRFSGSAPLGGRAGIVGCVLALGAAIGCDSGGVGDPCTPEDEFFDTFSGFALTEINVESRSFQCETRVCLVNKFQGRVSCPYGTNGTPAEVGATPTVDHHLPCEVPQFGGYVSVPVLPQRIDRSPEVAVYCSCRCAGADPNARYCECPSGFECAEIVVNQTNQNTGQEQLAGSYCVRSGSDVDPVTVSPLECSIPDNPASPGPDDLTCGTPPGPVVAGG
jgi:hypothetical protein